MSKSNACLTLTINLYKKEYTDDITLMLLYSVCKVLSTQDINHLLFEMPYFHRNYTEMSMFFHIKSMSKSHHKHWVNFLNDKCMFIWREG
jgi:hypothetical protein